MGGPSSGARKRLPALDGVRGIAILVVLVHNLSIASSSNTLLEKLWSVVVEAGWVGVTLFFALSGFLITGILLDAPPAARMRTFYARRTLRIAPLYYLGLVAYFVIAPRIAPSLGRPVGEVIWYWGFLSNWSVLYYGMLPGLGHVWSLAVEEQFYVVWPLFVRFTSRTTFAVICAALVVIALVARVAGHARGASEMWLYASTVTRMDAIACGALVALGLRSERWRPRLERALVPALALTLVLLGMLVVWTHGVNRTNPQMQIYGYSLFAIASAVLVAIAAGPSSGRLSAILSSRVLRFFGKYSYAIYLVHPPLKHLVFTRWEPELGAMLAARPLVTEWTFIALLTLASVGFALVSWVLLERPLLRVKEAWRGGQA